MGKVSLKGNFIFLTFIVVAIFIFTTIITLLSFKKTNQVKDTLLLSRNIEKFFLEQRKNEKDFLSLETKRPEYFINFESNYLESHKKNNDSIVSSLNSLREKHINIDNEISKWLAELSADFTDYQYKFNKIVNAYNERGFKDYGLEGA